MFSYYPADPRVRREAEALAGAGLEVDVVCLRDRGQPRTETVRGVRVHRLPVRRRRGGRLRYVWEYASFLILSFLAVTGLHLRRGYRLVHVHNMPDVLVFSALVPRLLGQKVLLDLHDPTPEVFMAKYGMSEAGRGIRLLRALERVSIRFAHLVITPNVTFREVFVARGCPESKIRVIMNSPAESIFAPAREAPPEPNHRGFTIMFHGTIVERHGLDTALEAVASLRSCLPEPRFEVYGEGDFVERFLALVKERKLEDVVGYHGFISQEEIARAIRGIDVGLIPNKRSPFTEINLPTRILEYLCLGKPVVAPRTAGILAYFPDDSLFLFEPGDAESLRAAILAVHADPRKRAEVLARGRAIYQRHRWEIERERLVDLALGLIGRDGS